MYVTIDGMEKSFVNENKEQVLVLDDIDIDLEKGASSQLSDLQAVANQRSSI